MRKSMLFTAICAVFLACSADMVASADMLAPADMVAANRCRSHGKGSSTCSTDTTTHTDTTTFRAGFFVSVNGSQMGDGSSTNPWNLATALAQPTVVHAGDTIWLRGGTYKGTFVSNLTGTAAAPVVLRQFPGERATIDGRFEADGQYTYYWGFEVTDSDPLRVTTTAGSRPADLPRNMVTVFVLGPFNKFINLVVHDLGDGLFAGSSAEGTEIYGSIFYNNGWIGPDRGHGHNVYLQNQNTTKLLTDNVLFSSFSSGLHIYGSDASYLQNIHVEGNTIFNSGDPAASTFGSSFDIENWGGALGSLTNIVYRNNSISHRSGLDMVAELNAPGALPGQDIEFSGNIVHGHVGFNEMKRYVVSGNKFTSGTEPLAGSSVLVGLRIPTTGSYSANVWNNNQYAAPPLSTQGPFYGVVNGSGTIYQFPTWKVTTGYDAGSAYTSGQFTNADIIVRANKYESGRATVTCWNWTGAGQLNVDLSAVLKSGDSYEIRHVFDLFGAPLLSGVYTGGTVSIPQPTLTPPTPLGYSQSAQMPDNRFNVFLVQKK